MSLWIRLSCDVLTDPKLLGVGLEAAHVWLRGLLYSQAHGLDGDIPTAALPLVAYGARRPGVIANQLVAAGLWMLVPGGWSVGAEKWARHQRTAEQLSSSRASAAERQGRARGKRQRAAATGDADAPPPGQSRTRHGVTDALLTRESRDTSRDSHAVSHASVTATIEIEEEKEQENIPTQEETPPLVPPLRGGAPESKPPKIPTISRATRMPDEYALDPGRREYAASKGLANVDRVWEGFCEYHRAKGSRFASWDAAWRTWVLRQVDYSPPQPKLNGSAYQTAGEKQAEASRELLRRAEEREREMRARGDL